MITDTNEEEYLKQKEESIKRARKKSAKALPPQLTKEMMKKYVVYYHEWLNPEKTRSREFFKIEKHPKMKKIWIGTKSNKITLLEKLNQVHQKIKEIEETEKDA